MTLDELIAHLEKVRFRHGGQIWVEDDQGEIRSSDDFKVVHSKEFDAPVLVVNDG
jgi:hypothetical protein